VRASRRKLGFSRSSPHSRRPELPSSAREHAALEEVQATLKLRDLEITQLSGELV
jgi:hypothetical protein